MRHELLSTQVSDLSSEIVVIGIGGGGSNAVTRMFLDGIAGVDYIVCNTDIQALESSPVSVKIQLGIHLTEGRGAGNNPEIGRNATLENIDDVRKVLLGKTRMVFITAGMGGGTGTGGAPVIAQACKELGYLTVAIVTIPFLNEGKRRHQQAYDGIKQLSHLVDSILVINNERIREVFGDLRISEAFAKADDILKQAAKSIAEIITVPGYINVDFADVETVMRNSGNAVMGTGVAKGDNRAIIAVKEALNSPLLDNNDISGAKDVLLNISSGSIEVTLEEIGLITDYVQEKVGFTADLIWGNSHDDRLEDNIYITVLATGMSHPFGEVNAINSTKNDEKEKFELELHADSKNDFEIEEDSRFVQHKIEKKRTKKLYSKVGENNSRSSVDSWFLNQFASFFEEDALHSDLNSFSDTSIKKNKSIKNKSSSDQLFVDSDVALNNTLSQLKDGFLKVIAPLKMRLGRDYDVRAQISKLKEVLESENDDLTIEKITIARVMKLILIGETFDITILNEPKQFLIENKLNEWRWRVKPKKIGKHKLFLRISVEIYLDKVGNQVKDFLVYEKEILVKIRMRYLLSQFIVNNWQWLIGLIVGSGLFWQVIKNWDIIKSILK